MDTEKVNDFLDEITELTKKHGIKIDFWAWDDGTLIVQSLNGNDVYEHFEWDEELMKYKMTY